MKVLQFQEGRLSVTFLLLTCAPDDLILPGEQVLSLNASDALHLVHRLTSHQERFVKLCLRLLGVAGARQSCRNPSTEKREPLSGTGKSN